MKLDAMLLPIRAIFSLAMDIESMSTRKYSGPEEMLTEAINNLVGEASQLKPMVDKLMRDKDFLTDPNVIKHSVGENEAISLMAMKCADLLGQLKQLPPGVRGTCLLMAIILEGGINLGDVLPDKDIEDMNRVMKDVAPDLEKLKQMVEDGDIEGAKKYVENIMQSGRLNSQFSKDDSNAQSVIERAKQLLNNMDKQEGNS